MPTAPAWRRRAAMLTLCAMSATGCSSLSTQPLPPVQPPRLPPPPAELMEPPASGSWSESALQLFRRWQRLLTPLTPA